MLCVYGKASVFRALFFLSFLFLHLHAQDRSILFQYCSEVTVRDQFRWRSVASLFCFSIAVCVLSRVSELQINLVP